MGCTKRECLGSRLENSTVKGQSLMRFFYREKTSEWPVKPKYRVEATEKSKNPPKCKSGHPEKPKCNLDIEQER